MTIQTVYLPNNVMKGAQSSIVDRSIVQDGDSGQQWRIKRESFPKRIWQIGWNRAQVPQIEQMFQAFGRHTGFLVLAPRDADHIVTTQTIGTGNGSTTDFQLKITLTQGSKTVTKNILHPKSTTMVITVGGTPQTESSDYAVNYSTGIVTFASPPAGAAAIVASFQYYTPVYFDSDQIATVVDMVGSNPLQEIRTATIIEAINE